MISWDRWALDPYAFACLTMLQEYYTPSRQAAVSADSADGVCAVPESSGCDQAEINLADINLEEEGQVFKLPLYLSAKGELIDSGLGYLEVIYLPRRPLAICCVHDWPLLSVWCCLARVLAMIYLSRAGFAQHNIASAKLFVAPSRWQSVLLPGGNPGQG